MSSWWDSTVGGASALAAEAAAHKERVWQEAAALLDETQDVVALVVSKADNLISFVVIAYLLWRNARLFLSKKRHAFAVHVVDIRCISSVLMLVVNCAVARWSTVMRSFLPVPQPYLTSRFAMHAIWTILSVLVAFTLCLAFVFTKGLAVARLRARFSGRKFSATRREAGASRRVVIFHASIGSGHKRAAQAVGAALKSLGDKDSLEVQVVDMLDFSTGGHGLDSFYTLVAKKGYMKAIQNKLGAAAYGYFFEQSNHAPTGIAPAVAKWVQRAFFLPFYDFVFRWNPDFIVSTHFLAPDLVDHLRDMGYVVPQLTVVTDFDAHSIWSHHKPQTSNQEGPYDQYLVPREEASIMLHHAGVPKDQIQVCGIPIVPEFSVDRDMMTCRDHFGLRRDRPVVLQMSGGDDVFDIYKALLEVETPCQIVVITGRQADVRSKLEAISVPSHQEVKLEGFTKEMHYYLAAADIIISKPGGLTTAESMASGTPMVIVNPIPGQETRNTDMLLEAGVAVKINDLPLLSYQVNSMLTTPGRLDEMQSKARALADPQAAFKVARTVLDYLAAHDPSESGTDTKVSTVSSKSTPTSAEVDTTTAADVGTHGDADEDEDVDEATQAANRAKLRKRRAPGRQAVRRRGAPGTPSEGKDGEEKGKKKAKAKAATRKSARRQATGVVARRTTRSSTRQINQPR